MPRRSSLPAHPVEHRLATALVALRRTLAWKARNLGNSEFQDAITDDAQIAASVAYLGKAVGYRLLVVFVPIRTSAWRGAAGGRWHPVSAVLYEVAPEHQQLLEPDELLRAVVCARRAELDSAGMVAELAPSGLTLPG